MNIVDQMLSVRTEIHETILAVAPTKIATSAEIVRCQGSYMPLLELQVWVLIFL